MFLEESCVSLCMMLKHSGLIGWPVKLLCWWIGEGALEMFLDAFSQCPAWFTYVFIRAVDVGALEVIDDSTLGIFLSLSLGVTSNVLGMFMLLKCTCMPLVWQTFLTFPLFPEYMGPHWWCSCCWCWWHCCLSEWSGYCYWCPVWNGCSLETYVGVDLVPNLEIDKPVGPSWYVVVPCLKLLG